MKWNVEHIQKTWQVLTLKSEEGGGGEGGCRGGGGGGGGGGFKLNPVWFFLKCTFEREGDDLVFCDF